MGCATIGDLREFLDGELAGEERARVERHLASCASCRESLEAARANARFAASTLPGVDAVSAPPRVAWSQIRDRAEGGVTSPVTLGWRMSEMLGNLSFLLGGSRMRVATSAVAALVVVGLLFTLSPVQTAASSFLSIFRVKKFVAVTVDPGSLPNLASPSEVGSFTYSGERKARSVTLAEAEKEVGFRVGTPATLPAGLEPAPRSVAVTGGFNATYSPDLEKVRAYLSSIGATNVNLPDNLDGAPITLQMPPSVAVLYAEKGAVERSADGLPKPSVGQRFLFLGATTSPTMNVPDGLDVERIRTEVLKIPGLPPDTVNQLKSIEDWRNTVVVPVVKGTSRDVTVQGEKGLLISEAGGQGITLLWLKGGIVYTLTGNVSENEILAAANSLQ